MNGSSAADRVNRAALSAGVSETVATHTCEVDPLTVTRRLQREGRWSNQAETTRDELMRSSKKAFPDKEQRQAWVYAELDRMYPPVQFPRETDTVSVSLSDPGSIQGLPDLPQDWPQLPANASIASEVGWVQANRLRIVEERPGKATRVRLDQAHSPAPSWAALSWLETSIRSYAKYVDVAAKVSDSEENEASVMRAERKSIEEVKALLAEMLPGPPCPTCGQATPSDWERSQE